MDEPLHQLYLFARYPKPGRAKTRLIPALGPEGAARLSRRLTEHALQVAKASCTHDFMCLTVCATGGSHRNFRAWLGHDLNFIDQPGGDIGIRMQSVFEHAFKHGARGALLIGSDLPDISTKIMQQAHDALSDHDVVLGPAVDGGYYLIGMKRCHPELFTEIDWGSTLVAKQTRSQAARLNLSLAEVAKLSDVDLPEDLHSLRNDPRFIDVFSGTPRLSVVIPTLNEAEVLSTTLERAQQGDTVEIIVADGASRDATRDIAEKAGVVVVTATGGRAAQLNAGAARATGRHLLFLHADTLLPGGYEKTIRRTLDNPATVAGAFQFQTEATTVGMRIVTLGTNIRSKLFRLPYGDQGLFLEKRVFNELGGFADMPIMEDFELVRRLRRRGRVVTVPETVITSARRWQKLGILRTMMRNQAVILGYFTGISPKRLARFYRTNGKEQL